MFNFIKRWWTNDYYKEAIERGRANWSKILWELEEKYYATLFKKNEASVLQAWDITKGATASRLKSLEDEYYADFPSKDEHLNTLDKALDKCMPYRGDTVVATPKGYKITKGTLISEPPKLKSSEILVKLRKGKLKKFIREHTGAREVSRSSRYISVIVPRKSLKDNLYWRI